MKIDMRLAEFIRQNIEGIVSEWIIFAQTRTPASEKMTDLALKDHIVEILIFVADDIESAQSKKEQSAKSKGLGPQDTPFTQSAAEVHALLRLGDGFDIDQMVSEYRALRASVVKQWVARKPTLESTDLDDLTRFNEAIDQAMTESVAQYTKTITRSRNLFLGMLGHDLRNPIGAAMMAAQIVAKISSPETKQSIFAHQIVSATERSLKILNDLLDLTRSSFGTEIPVVREPMSLGELGAQLVTEMRMIAKDRHIGLNVVGDTNGHWDQARIGQVLSNLIANALQYSAQESKVVLTITDKGDQVLFSIHNDGEPISPEKIKVIFDPMTRGADEDDKGQTPNLGLGLFIANKIVMAHGGNLDVTSSAEFGTEFAATLPRH